MSVFKAIHTTVSGQSSILALCQHWQYLDPIGQRREKKIHTSLHTIKTPPTVLSSIRMQGSVNILKVKVIREV